MNKKQQIIETSIAVFNEMGIRNTTTRHIADRMGMSAGNLHYHFKHTEDIILQIFQQLIQEFDEMMEVEHSGPWTLKILEDRLAKSFAIQQRYKFVFINFVELGKWIPQIAESYRENIQKRQIQFRRMIVQLQEDGTIAASLSPEELEILVSQIFILADFWISFNELVNQLDGQSAIDHYQAIILRLLQPYIANGAKG